MNRQELLELAKSYEFIGTKYHTLKTGSIPSKEIISGINREEWQHFLEYVKKTYEYDAEDYFKINQVSSNGDAKELTFLHLKSNITLYNSFFDETELIFDSSSVKEILKDLRSRFELLIPKKSVHSIGLIRYYRSRLEVKFFDYQLPKHSLIHSLDNATQSFYDHMIENLRDEQNNGLYLLYGQPGTGKTSFIKEILSKTPKETLFISPSFTKDLTSPELVSLLMEHPGSILVIEDAETVLMERKADNSSAVSNLLNLTDGFLSDFLNLNIICTFNTELENIDKALLRDGRLKGMHKFEKIQAEKAQEIASLLGRDIEVEKPMTLAEICNSQAKSKEHQSSKIGFISSI